MKSISKYFILFCLICADEYASDNDRIRCEYIIEQTNINFKKLKNYEVDISVELDIPGIRMPKSEYKVSFKQPNQIDIVSEDFGILPKAGLFESPEENFNNLEDKRIIDDDDSLKENEVIVEGYAIFDSLKFVSPNEYFKMLEPIVEVRVDTLKWVVNSVSANIERRRDRIPLFEITNTYQTFDNQYVMPVKSIAKYYIKDKKLSNWLNKDSDNYLDQITNQKDSNLEAIVEGSIEVNYSNYIINKK